MNGINIYKAHEIAEELKIEIPQKFMAKVIMNKQIIKKLISKWKRRGSNTYCGQLTSNFFLEAGYDMAPILYGKSLWNINTTGQYGNALNSVIEGLLKEVTAEQAYYLVLVGRPSLCLSPKTMKVNNKPYNHAAITWPEWRGGYNIEKGPKIAQQGWFHLVDKYISHKYAWGKNWINPMVKYFLPGLV